MILGIGIDITELARIEKALTRLGDKFVHRILAPAERQECLTPRRKIEYVAGRFAAKEAASKALGTGIGRVGLHDLVITPNDAGAPLLTLHGYAAEWAAEKGILRMHLSISHSDHYAVAQVIAEGDAKL